MFINISDNYGEQGEVTIEDYQTLNPDGEFKECWDGTIVEILSDEPGDWGTVAVSAGSGDRRLNDEWR